MKTPETDVAEYYIRQEGHYVRSDLARRLERERDEAREDLREIKEYGTEEMNAAVDLRQKLAQALIERDEARKAMRKWETLCLWGGTPEHIHDFIQGQQRRIHEAQDIEKTCEQLERERDEALFLLKAAQSALDAIHLEVGDWIKIMKENTD